MKKVVSSIFLVISLIILLTPITIANGEFDFILPQWGGCMVHSDPSLSDYVSLPVPKDDVKILWHRNNRWGEKAGSKGNGIAGNGEIAACTFSDFKNNLVIYDYDGNRLWESGDLLNIYTFFSTPMVDIHGQVIACDNRIVIKVDTLDCDNDGKIIEWISKIPYGGLPFSPVITADGTLIIATDRGPVYAYNITDGSLLGWKFLGEDAHISLIYRLLNIDDPGFFSTINSPCVNGNRIYVSTQYKGPFGFPTLLHHARLYAIDIDVENPNIKDRLSEVWYFEFGGPSQASPTIINETIYFDGAREKPSLLTNTHIFAITDKGDHWEEKWRTNYPNPTMASLSYDPRGGIWLIDSYSSSGKLVHFSTEDGSIIEEIKIDDIVNEKGRHVPTSVATICGNDTNPVLIVSASALRNVLKSFISNSYIIAIDLEANNSLLWKVKLFESFSISMDFAFGQYTILIKDNSPRVVFASFRNGIWAIGNEK